MATVLRRDQVNWGGTKSHSRRLCKVSILGTAETVSLPIEVTTKVVSIKEMLAPRMGVSVEALTFLTKTSCSYRQLYDFDEVPSNVILKGVKSFTRQKASYLHPHCIIGAGHMGLRQALQYQKEGFRDFALYDKLDQVGGVAWVQNANPTSKLQTELGVYHLNYHPDWAVPTTMKTWPSRQELLDHFEEVCRDFGTMAHVQLQTEVVKIKKVIDRESSPYDPGQCHFIVSTESTAERKELETDLVVPCDEKENLTSNELFVDFDETIESDPLETMVKPVELIEHNFSTVACYPGGLVSNIRFEYRGEEVFLGQIGYGMFNEFDYTQVKDCPVVVMGMGAFGVENVRTCLEHGASKVALVCRRKNIAIPRAIDWWINQSVYPPPAAMMLNAMKPMYDLIPDDPWSYYAVQASQDRRTATIKQKSRFGIGDFYFLSSFYGKSETIVDSIKRLRETSIVMESAQSIAADHFIKVLGFNPDQKIDKLFGVKDMLGFFPNGDWRLFCCCEFPGIDAGRFGGTSLSPGGLQASLSMTWIVNYPSDARDLLAPGVLPKQKADQETGRPAYQWPARAGGSIYMIMGSGVMAGLAEQMGAMGPQNRIKMIECHPLQNYLQECEEEWYKYCQMFKDSGDDRPFPTYPYTYEFMKELVQQNDAEGEAEMQAMLEKQRARA